ncbi:MAG: response regulator [Bacteroidota bacterium]
MKQQTIIIADDHPFFRKGLLQLLRSVKNIKVVGEAETGRDALSMIGTLHPDAAVLDIDMPEMRGLDVLEEMNKKKSGTSVVFMTMYKEPELVRRALSLGAKGYLLKESVVEELIQCLSYVAKGKTYVSPVMAAVMAAEPSRPAEDQLPGIDKLTQSERRVLRLVAENRSSKEISEELNISSRTVDNHRSHICEKLGITGTHALLRFALQHKDRL